MDRDTNRAVAACLGLGLLAGCAGTTPKAQPVAEVNSGLGTLLAGDTPFELMGPDGTGPVRDVGPLAAQAALDLEEILKAGAMGQPKAVEPAASPLGELAQGDPLPPVVVEPPPSVDPEAAAKADEAWAALKPATPAGTPAAEAASTGDPVADLAIRIARLLRETSDHAQAAVALASLEALRPGVFGQMADPSSALSALLPGADRATLLEARERVITEPGAASEAVRSAISALQGPAPQVKIRRAALCTRVEGFGRYTAYASETFVAGVPIRAIVYTELDQFASREARAGDPMQKGVPMGEQTSVELAQTLSLFHDESGLLAWHRPAQSVTETTRASRRDFYLIQQIELPRTLSIGRYNLKVTVKDKTTGAEAEAILPISVVADPTLVKGK